MEVKVEVELGMVVGVVEEECVRIGFFVLGVTGLTIGVEGRDVEDCVCVCNSKDITGLSLVYIWDVGID